LGNRIVRKGQRIEISPVVVECWSEPMGWVAVWKHQLRWARTIRVCQPLPYFFSILSNGVLWPLLWVAANPSQPILAAALGCWLVRIATAVHLQARLTGSRVRLAQAWLVPVKDLLQTALWLTAFLGNSVEWRGQRMRIRRDGTLARIEG
jgi:ceramide glucosyltransferase